MATHDVDQKLLGRLAKETGPFNALLSSSLFKILGISIRLTRRLLRARKLRKLETAQALRDTRTQDLYYRIIFLSREGLTITEQGVLVYTEEEKYHGPLMIELKIFAYKLRASFYHIFCLFHNDPPVSQLDLLRPPGIMAMSQGLSNQSPNIQTNVPGASNPDNIPVPAPEVPDVDKENQQAIPPTRGVRSSNLRDTIPSMVSDTSYVTNPYSVNAITPPPGLPPVPISQRSNFIMPSDNFVPMATLAFNQAANQSIEDLAGSNPLRLSVQLERCAFLWDCVHDYEGSRRLAAQAIYDCQQAEEGMDDTEFEDAVSIVGTLGLFMKRNSSESTPRFGTQTPRSVASPVREAITPLPSIAETNVTTAQQQEQQPTHSDTVQIRLDRSTIPQASAVAQARPSSAKTPPGSPPNRRSGSRNGNSNRRSPRSPQSALAGSPSSPSRPRTRRGSNGNGSAAARAQRRNNGNGHGNGNNNHSNNSGVEGNVMGSLSSPESVRH